MSRSSDSDAAGSAALIQVSSDAMYMKDLQGRYLMINDAGALAPGQSRAGHPRQG